MGPGSAPRRNAASRSSDRAASQDNVLQRPERGALSAVARCSVPVAKSNGGFATVGAGSWQARPTLSGQGKPAQAVSGRWHALQRAFAALSQVPSQCNFAVGSAPGGLRPGRVTDRDGARRRPSCAGIDAALGVRAGVSVPRRSGISLGRRLHDVPLGESSAAAMDPLALMCKCPGTS